MDIEYRRAFISDLDAAELIEQYAPEPWTSADIANAINCDSARSYIALADKQAVAFCSLHAVEDEATLNTLTVLPHARRRGIARGLLTFAFQDVSARHIYLEVRGENTQAQALYSGLGFAAVGLRKGFYSSPADDAIIMSKHIL